MTSLSTEVLLRILGYLDDPRDLVRCRQTSRRMQSIAGDTLLWRDLFINTFLKSYCDVSSAQVPHSKKRRRLSNSEKKNTNSIPARVIEQIPRLQSDNSLASRRRDNKEDLKIDWYTLYKISHNWQTGSFSTRFLQKGQTKAHLASSSIVSESLRHEHEAPSTSSLRTLVDSTSSYVFAAFNPDNNEKDSATIFVYHSNHKGKSKEEGKQESIASYSCPRTESDRGIVVTSLAVDRGRIETDMIQIFVGYSNGTSSLILFDTTMKTLCKGIEIERKKHAPIVAAVLTFPLLVTCTDDFHLRLYKVGSSTADLIEERKTYSCHWPASLRLQVTSDSDLELGHRFSIAYSTPVYPLGWTVGLQEIIIKKDLTTSSRSASARKAHVITCVDSSYRHVDPRKEIMSIEERRQQVGKLTSLSYENPYIVVGTNDNEVVCFKVHGVSSSGESRDNLGLNHVCNFQGHTGTVHSVSLNEGRCVTGGSDGSVRIWRLGDEEVALAKAAGLLATFDARLRKGLGKVITINSSLTSSSKRKRSEEMEERSNRPLSLAEILRDNRGGAMAGNKPSTSAIIRMVTSGFDQIISVSAIRSIMPSGHDKRLVAGQCRVEAAVEEEEQVQVWSFA